MTNPSNHIHANQPGLIEATQQIGDGLLDPTNLIEQSFNLANQVEPNLKAFVSRGTLEDLKKNLKPGPLSGIPIGIKDIINTVDFVTTNGSPIYAQHRPKADAPIVQKIRSLGGIVFGKTVTTQFAWKTPGPTVNPHHAEHTPGGSSSGSAAAVAAGIVPLALGTQTVGSVVRPAAFCGVVGLKPSYGAINKEGVHPFSTSLDHIGLFTRSVDDVAYAYELLKNDDQPSVHLSTSKTITPMQQPRIAFIRTPFDDLLSQEQVQLMQLVVEKLTKAGATVQMIDLPAKYWDGVGQLQTIMTYEAAKVHQDHVREHSDLLCQNIKDMVNTGSQISDAQYQTAMATQQRLRKEIAEVFKDYDVLLCAPATGEAPKGLGSTGDPSFCALGSFLGIPAINIPAGKSKQGLPLGAQLMANYQAEELLLKAAKFLESSLTF